MTVASANVCKCVRVCVDVDVWVYELESGGVGGDLQQLDKQTWSDYCSTNGDHIHTQAQ